jgi:hypothetical protein
MLHKPRVTIGKPVIRLALWPKGPINQLRLMSAMVGRSTQEMPEIPFRRATSRRKAQQASVPAWCIRDDPPPNGRSLMLKRSGVECLNLIFQRIFGSEASRSENRASFLFEEEQEIFSEQTVGLAAARANLCLAQISFESL